MNKQPRSLVARTAVTLTAWAWAAGGCSSELPTGETVGQDAGDAAGAAETTMDARPAPDAASVRDAAAAASDARPPSSQLVMIDDMENSEMLIPIANSGHFFSRATGSIGNWFFASSTGPLRGDATETAIQSPRGTSKYARHVQGSKLEDGMNMWAQLNHPSGGPVNMSPYAGIAFWARLTGGNQTLFVAVRDRATGPANPPDDLFGGDFNGSPWFVQRLTVSKEWQRFVLLFDDFQQGALAPIKQTRSLDTSAVVSIDFQTGVGGSTFDLWIDDLAALCRGACPPNTQQ